MVYLLLILAIAGAGLGIYSPSVRVAIADLTSERVRSASLRVFFSTPMFGLFLGPSLSGVIADQRGEGFPFLISDAGVGLGTLAASALSPGLSKAST